MKVNKFLKSLSDTRIFFWATLWLIVLLFVGTIAQKDIGLYQAQERYFSSFIILLGGFLPMPGGAITMGVIFVGLLSKLIYKTPLTIKNSGIAITHLGSFLLLTGGLLTGLFSFEGNMVIPEGQSVNFFKDYHKLEVAIIDTSPKDEDITYAFSQGYLKKGNSISIDEIPFKITILDYCRNCNILPITKEVDESFQGFAKRFELSEKELEIEDGDNRAGMLIQIDGSDNDGKYLNVEYMPVAQTIKANNKIYKIELRHKRYRLPFEIELIDFDKQMYAATSMAKSYKSVVRLKDGKLKQRTVIQMNEPLRYKGYTFYQSSFIEQDGSQTTILATVKNIGRMFPYISSIIICIGLLIHLLLNSKKLFTKRTE
ncbi:cytochrome c biogenesis protein ResB [Halobacteriovorax sp. HLS]|uniref:cytochrome c biogenesis protein ResB n=1 Tax=Halobacteriovorax sp. HLS TaxID=2234000 RepID=UPI000FD8E91D|nr:cytochrome c biogenesis protein ResB [Halobacteriovorax sp. HLS]